jgi:hypothetical protein
MLALAAAAVLMREEQSTRERAAAGPDPTSPWAIADGWQRARPGDALITAPQSDGGPGFVGVLAAVHPDMQVRSSRVRGQASCHPQAPRPPAAVRAGVAG